MKLETFFEKFELFADAPDAVAKMRELVLQLAVQGKLVDQKRSDGNAAQLLAAISKERDKRAAKLRTPDEPASAESGEHAFPIPSNWVWTQLGNIALQIQYGYTASADPSATEIRMLRITDIQNNRVDWPSVPGCQSESDEAEKYLLSPNDILIARTGGTIGKSFIVPDAPVKSVFASYLIRVTPPQSMAARYLKTFLESPLYWSQLRQMSAGTGQPNVNGQALGRLAIPLPPLAEQKRIVAKVDELMALCDLLEAQHQEREEKHKALSRASLARFADAPTPANLQFLFHPSYDIAPANLRKTILTLAVQGKLVPQDPNDEPAEDLLARILAEKKQLVDRKVIGRDKDWPLDEDLQPTFVLPVSWVFSTLAKIGLINPRNEADDDISASFVPMKLISAELRVPHEHEIRKWVEIKTGFTHFAERDVSLAKITPCFENGKSTVMRNLANGIGAGTTELHVVRPILVEADYILIFLKSSLFVEAGIPKMTGTAGQKRVPTSYFAASPFPLPPLAEQKRIVAKVEELMKLVDALETQLAASRTTAANLLSAIVAELTGTPNTAKASVPASTNTGTGTGRRGRPPKS